MLDREHLYTPSLANAVAKVFRKLAIIPDSLGLPDPVEVLYGESEEAATCYYSLGESELPVRMLAVKIAAAGKIAKLWNSIDRFRATGVHAALLPINSSTRDDNIVIYDDGAWISKVLLKRQLLSPKDTLSDPPLVLSGRAGLSRVYWYHISSAGDDRASRSLLFKFDRPDRFENEWSAIETLREYAEARQIVLPIHANDRADGAIVYNSFGRSAIEVLPLDHFLVRQFDQSVHIARILEQLQAFTSELYSRPNYEVFEESWEKRFPDLANAIASIQDQEHLADLSGIEAQLRRLSSNRSTISLPNPVAALPQRLRERIGPLSTAAVHGDLQSTNILLALGAHSKPEMLAVIDIEKFDRNQPIAEDLALLEVDFIRSIYPEVAKLVLGKHVLAIEEEALAVQFLVLVLTSLVGKEAPPAVLTERNATLANFLGAFILAVRNLFRESVLWKGPSYDPRQYFRFLYFHSLRALSYPMVTSNALKRRLLLAASSLAEQTLSDLESGVYDEGRSSPKLIEKWPQVSTAETDPFSEIFAQRKAIREAVEEDCGEVAFLTGDKLGMKPAFCPPVVRGRPQAKSDAESLIQSEVEKQLEEAAIPRPTPILRVTPEEQIDPLGTDWPTVSLDDRLRDHCGSSRTDRRALLLIDEPGGGKTTTLQNIAWRVATGVKPFKAEYRKPVFVRLGEWAKRQGPNDLLPLSTYLASTRSSENWPGEDQWLDDLQNGGLFLALDGLDELGPRSPLARYLRREIPRWIHSANCVVITCRARSVDAYGQLQQHCECLRIDGFDEPSQRQFINNYPKPINKGILLKQLRESDVLSALARNPFLLDVLCYLAYREKGALPSTRNEIIGSAISKVLGDGIETDSERRQKDHSDFDVPTLENLLARTALELRLRDDPLRRVANRFSYTEFLEAIRAVLSERDVNTAQSYAEFFSSTRLLRLPTDVSRSDQPIGSFVHGLFFEWLAALGLKLHASGQGGWDRPFPADQKKTPRKLLDIGVFHPGWTELLTFLPSRLDDPMSFFRILLNFDDDIGGNRLSLALRAFVELPVSQRELPEIRELGIAIGQKSWELVNDHLKCGTLPILAPALTAGASNMLLVCPQIMERLETDLSSSKLTTRIDALQWLARIGISAAEIAPELIGEYGLRAHDGNVRKLTAAALLKMGSIGLGFFADALADTDWTVQMSACEAVAEFGAPSAIAEHAELFQAFLRLISHRLPPLQAAACRALGRIGSATQDRRTIVEKLLATLSDPQQPLIVRASAIQSLGRLEHLGGESGPALDALLTCVGESEELVYAPAIEALRTVQGELQSQRSQVVTVLARLLQSESGPRVWGDACEVLALLTPDAVGSAEMAALLTHTKTLLHHPDATLRIKASEALLRLGVRSGDLDPLTVLIESLRDNDWNVRTRAVATFKTLGTVITSDLAALNAVISLLDEPPWFVRASTCEALGSLEYKPNTPQLVIDSIGACLSPSQPPMVRARAVEALGRLRPNQGLTRVQITDLIGCLKAEDEWFLNALTCEALAGKLNVPDMYVAEVVAAVLDCLTIRDWCVRASACDGLGQLSSKRPSEGAVEALIASLCDSQEPVRKQSSSALSHLVKHGVRIFAVPEKEEFLVTTGSKRFYVAFDEQLPHHLRFQFRASKHAPAPASAVP